MTVDPEAIAISLKDFQTSVDQRTLELIKRVVTDNYELFSKPDPELTSGKPLHEHLFEPRIYYISERDFSVLKLVAELALKAHSPSSLLKALWSAHKRYKESRSEFSTLPGLVLRAMTLARGSGIKELEQSLREDKATAEILDQSSESLREALHALANTEPPMIKVQGEYVSICDV